MKKVLLPLFLFLALAAAWLAWRATTARAVQAVSPVTMLSNQDTAGYARALEPDAVAFPRDLGPHPAYRTEWWYYTGNLQTAEGRPFGFQLTFFRTALAPAAPQVEGEATSMAAGYAATPSAWRTNQAYLAHFTVSDIDDARFYPAEQFSRGAAGLAGAQAEPYQVWLNDWSVRQNGPETLELVAHSPQANLQLTLRQTLPPVLHGQGGLSQKGAEPGNASYYYSVVRLESAGTLTVDGRSYAVTGLSWNDHEYGTSALGPQAVGWDWFSAQFDDGTALMFFQIRRNDGRLEPQSSGSFIQADGQVVPLQLGDWALEVLDTWRSPHSGGVYPVAWRLRLQAIDLELEGRALMPDQELNVSTTYWEGATAFAGTRAGQPISGRGYVEMTGYAGP